MLNQENKNALRKAMYEDVDVFYDFYTGKWEEDAFEEAKEAVPGITKEEFDQYRNEDRDFITGIMKIVLEANKDEIVLNKIFDSNILKAEGEWIRPRLQSSSFFSTFVSTAGVLFP